MSKFFKNRNEKTGLPPGSLVHIGEKKMKSVRINIIDYDAEHFEEREASSIEECFGFRDKPTVTWINIDGLHQVDILEKIGHSYGIHPLVLEDILNTDQRPKVEEYDTYIFIAVKMLDFLQDSEVGAEQISFILGRNFVISFQENIGDIFTSVREDLRGAKGRVRKEGADFLLYRLLDTIVDHYFIIMERLGEDVETMEGRLLEETSPMMAQEINHLKREILLLRKSIWPMREVMSILVRSDSPLLHGNTAPFLQDVYDHIIHVIETLEIFRDMLTGTLDVYLSSMSNRLNEIMKVLTIISTIFIPLTFIVGVYGMNFKYMPELEEKWTYPMVWVVMVLIAIAMLIFFRRKKWI